LRKFWKQVGIIVKSLFITAGDLIERVPPRNLTTTRMRVTEVRIRSYWAANRRLPASLSDLPRLQGRDNSTNDGWGKPIHYEITGPSTVTLSSPGPKGRSNQAGSNEEISITFDAAA